MHTRIKKQLGEKLLQEAGKILEKYCHQTLDEVINDLRIRCLIDRDAEDAVSLIYGLHASKLFYQLHSEAVVYVRDAMARFVNGEIGFCKNCNYTIPQEWLMRNPMIEYCSHCMVKVSASHREVSIRGEVYAYSSR